MNTTTNSQNGKDNAVCKTAECKDVSAEARTKREQLRSRVKARIRELEDSLTTLKSQAGNVRRCSALETELQLVYDCMAGGWANVGEVEAAKLNQWLDNTKFLTLRMNPHQA